VSQWGTVSLVQIKREPTLKSDFGHLLNYFVKRQVGLGLNREQLVEGC
jgi:hypothetical protein